MGHSCQLLVHLVSRLPSSKSHISSRWDKTLYKWSTIGNAHKVVVIVSARIAVCEFGTLVVDWRAFGKFWFPSRCVCSRCVAPAIEVCIGELSHVFKIDQHILWKLKASSNDEEWNENSHVGAEAKNSSAQTVDQCHSCQGKVFLKKKRADTYEGGKETGCLHEGVKPQDLGHVVGDAGHQEDPGRVVDHLQT